MTYRILLYSDGTVDKIVRDDVRRKEDGPRVGLSRGG